MRKLYRISGCSTVRINTYVCPANKMDMKQCSYPLLLIVICLSLITMFSTGTYAIEPLTAVSFAAGTNEVSDRIPEEKHNRVIVRLRKKPIEGITATTFKVKAKKRFLLKNLKTATQKHKDRIVKRLNRKRSKEKQHNLNPQSLWLANSIAITVTPDEIRELSKDPDVVEVVPNILLSIPPIEIESVEGSEADPYLWNHEAIELDFARSQGIDGNGIRIGHLDTGIDTNHPDLQRKLIAWQEFDDFGNSVDSLPHESHYRGHGTHVASVIVGDLTGIAPGAKLLSALVLPGGYGTMEQVLSGMQWTLDPDGDPETNDGAQIVNMSWGNPGTSSILREAVDNMTAAGVLPVAAIGNDGWYTTYSPANVPGAIGVGAINEYDNITVFSGGGEVCWENSCLIKPEITAPGAGIYGADISGGYQFLSGTSTATPHVSGVAALLLQYESSLTLPQLRSFLVNSASDLGPFGIDSRFGWGCLNVKSALDFIDSYAERIGSKDLIIEKTVNISGKNSYYYYTYFSDGKSAFLSNESATLIVKSPSESCEIEPVGTGDLDGDGFADIIIREVTPIENDMYTIHYDVYLSRDAIGFSKKRMTWYSFETTDPDAYKLVAIADVNGDRKADLVLSQAEPQNGGQRLYILVMLSTGTGFGMPVMNQWATLFYNLDYMYQAGVGDVNGDGKSDLIFTKTYNSYMRYYPTHCYVMLSNGYKFESQARWLTIQPVYPYSPIEQYYFSDINGDKFADLVFTDRVENWQGIINARVHVCLSNGSYRFLSSTEWAEIEGDHPPLIETFADVNGDGTEDLVFRYFDSELNSYAFHVWTADKQNEQFTPCTSSWFQNPNGSLSGELKLVNVDDVGLGTWGKWTW